jgi:glycosyltransferase involved in cell wall biosynthesis
MGGLAECIEDGVDGLAFDGGDVDGLADAMDRLAHEDGLLERLQAQIQAPRGFADWIDELEAYYGGERPGRVAGPGQTPTAVQWVGDMKRSTSLARINREVCAQLDDDPEFVVQRLALDGGGRTAPLPHTADIEIRHQWPPDFSPPDAGRLVLIQPWEYGAIPQAWLQPLKSVVDELWVPSEYVRSMYVGGGVDAAKVRVIANGVDLDQFNPVGPQYEIDGVPDGALRFLFVGGVIPRKGPDVLIAAWRKAFSGREDVVLIIKDFGADDIYMGDRRLINHAIEDPHTAPVVYLNADLTDAEVADMYRAADVLVHPYRGEGFAMPVLEAMASGLPTITTAGGPTDEFCPPDAGWRIDSQRLTHPITQIEHLPLTGQVWDLEPSVDHLAELLVAAAEAGKEELAARGAAARKAAESYGWDQIAARYAERITAVCARSPLNAATPSADELELESEGQAPRVLAAPAWRANDDRLGELLRAWEHSGSSGTLILLADPEVDGTAEQIQEYAMAAAQAAGADLSRCPDIAIRFEARYPGRDAALMAQCDGYVPLHDGVPGLARIAEASGVPVLRPDLEGLPASVPEQQTEITTQTQGIAA